MLAEAIAGLMLVKQGKYDEAIAIAENISAVPVMQAEAYVIAGEVSNGKIACWKQSLL